MTNFRNIMNAVDKLFESDDLTTDPNTGEDKIEMSVPLFLRCLEWAREAKPTDVDLHKFTENALDLDSVLDIDDYDSLLTGTTTEDSPDNGEKTED